MILTTRLLLPHEFCTARRPKGDAVQVLLRILSKWVSLIELCECKAECLLVGLYR